MTLEEAARLAGEHRWAEVRLFETLGGWVASTSEAEVKLALDRHSQHHAWRAQQWWDRLPVVAGIDRDALTRAGSPGREAAFAALADLDGTVARLAGAYRFALPRSAAAYDRHRSNASPISDSSALRTLELVSRDLAADWLEGEVLLQAMIVDGDRVDAAAATVARLERLWLS